MSTPAFSPERGGLGIPIGRLNGLGVNSVTVLPYALGASSRGDGDFGGGVSASAPAEALFWGEEDFGGGVEVGAGAFFSARR